MMMLRLYGSQESKHLGGRAPLVAAAFGCCLLFAPCLHAQTTANEWTWMGGSSSSDQPGVYGILGTPASANTPGSRSGASTWTDNDGNLWLFGGYVEDVDVNGNGGYSSDLWKFDPTAGDWTWMGGTISVSPWQEAGVYGTLGVPATGNFPGGRGWALSWTDSTGKFWLFGGIGSDAAGGWGYLNDLWRFDPSTKQWAWISGSSTIGPREGRPGVYGTLGRPSAENVPGARVAAAGWIDSDDNLWLFGGSGFDGNDSSVYFNDLWKFDPSISQWTWIGGSDTYTQCTIFCSQPGVYGTQGTPAAGNVPGGRMDATSWTDSSGNFWLFGGEGSDIENTESPMNDLWQFSPSTKQWTWMDGSSNSMGGQHSIYGALGTPAAANTPGARVDAWGWTDNLGNLWLFGGRGTLDDGSTSFGEASLDELWEYRPSTKQWAWMDSSDSLLPNGIQQGVYGTLGVGVIGNIPPGREDSAGWTDSGGNFWLFGGDESAAGTALYLNDFWRYQPYAITTTPTFSLAAGTYLQAQTVTISDSTPDAVIYYTTDGTKPTTSSSVFSGALTVPSSEVVKAIAVASGYPTSAMATAMYAITPPAATPTFNPAPGTYVQAQTVTISDSAPGAVIYYTIDGTTPTTRSVVYSGALTVSSSETINAIALANGYSASAIATAPYTITPPAATPTFTKTQGTYPGTQAVAINDATPNAIIYFTTDGSIPTTSSTVYTGAFTISSSETVNAIATAPGYVASAVASTTLTIDYPAIKSMSPAFADAGGAAFTLTINGTGFLPDLIVYWGSSALVTQFVSATRLTAQVPAGDIVNAGITPVTARTSASGGWTSDPFQYEVDSATSGTSNAPFISSPAATVAAGQSANFPVTVPSTVSSVSVTCLNLPAGTTCSYAAVSNAVTITTSAITPKGTYQITVVFTETVAGPATAGILLPLLLLPLVAARKKFCARGIWLMACAGLTITIASLCIGCGGGGATSSATSTSTTTTHQTTSSGSISLTIQ